MGLEIRFKITEKSVGAIRIVIIHVWQVQLGSLSHTYERLTSSCRYIIVTVCLKVAVCSRSYEPSPAAAEKRDLIFNLEVQRTSTN